MGLFGKKKYTTNVTRDNVFLKDYAIKINGLLRFTEDNPKVTAALKRLQEDFQFTIATQVKDAEKIEGKIKKKYEALKNALLANFWDEDEVLSLIRSIGMEIDEINSMRR